MLVVYLFIYKLILAANPPECHSSMLSLCGLLSNPYHSSLTGTLVRLALQMKELRLRECKHSMSRQERSAGGGN